MAEPAVMDRDESGESTRCCGAAAYVLLRKPTDEEIAIAQETCAAIAKPLGTHARHLQSC